MYTSYITFNKFYPVQNSHTCIHWLTGEYSLSTDYTDLHAVAKTNISNKTKRKKEKEKKVFSINFNMMKVEV